MDLRCYHRDERSGLSDGVDSVLNYFDGQNGQCIE